MRQVLMTVMSVALPLVLAVGVAETFVRVAYKDGVEYTLEMWKYARYGKRIAKDPSVGHEHVPGAKERLMGVDVDINSRGLRDREFPLEKPEGVTRILMLGDSLTFGWGVPQDETTPKQLERMLNQRNDGRRYEVINTGVGNYNTTMEIAYFFNEGVKYQPDIVLLNFFINDAEPTPRYQGNVFNETFQSWVWLNGRLDIARRGQGEHKDWRTYYSDLYRDDAPAWQQAQAAMARLGDWCRSAGVPCAVVNQPELHNLREYPFLDVNEKVAKAAASASMRYLDLLPAMGDVDEPTLWVTVPDPHPNAKACGLFANGVVPLVDRLLQETVTQVNEAAGTSGDKNVSDDSHG